jgi:predicted porin
MQKKIIALAVAALASSAAFAQSNVTVYGVVDAGVARYSGSGSASSTQVINSGLTTSRLGFKGVEDLGNGLKALFVLEYRLQNDTNAGIGGNYAASASPTAAVSSASGMARQQLLGLTGGFGTVAAGRLQTTAYDWAVKYQTLVATAFDAANLVTTKGGFRVNTGADVRADNALAYISPNFSGFTFALNTASAIEQAVGVAPAAATSLRANLASVDYTNGPIAAGLVYENLKGSDLNTTNQVDWALGGSYNFGVAKLNATYQTTKDKSPAGVGILGNTNKAYHVGVTVPFGKSAVVASYAANRINTTAINDNAKAWNVAYTYELSKRTKAYAGYARAANGSDAVANSLGYGAAPVTTNGSTSVLAAGLAHSF